MSQGPSTEWRERIAPDEEERFARQAQKLAPMHAALSARYGAGRLLHRQPVLAAHGTLEILDGLPDYARHRISPRRASMRRWRELSNAAAAVQPNAKPGIRGFAVKVLGVAGAAALGGTAERRTSCSSIRRASPRATATNSSTSSPTCGAAWRRSAQADPPQRPRRRPQAVEAPRRDGRPSVLRLRQRDLRHAVAVHRLGPYAARARLTPRSNRRRPAAGFLRRSARSPRRRAARLRAGAAVLYLQGFDANRGSHGACPRIAPARLSSRG